MWIRIVALAAGIAMGTSPAFADDATSPPTRFTRLADLARLPWFEATAGGGLRLRDAAVGPVIDCHTHLAQTIGPQHQPALTKRTAHTHHYLATSHAFDLDPYANKNFTPDALHALERDLTFGALRPGGMRATHTAPNLKAEMDTLGISHSVLLPIDLPGVSDNAGRWAAAARGIPGLVPFGSVHPRDPGGEKRLAVQAAAGMKGIKVHPAVQLIAPEEPAAMRLYGQAGARGMIVFWHCGPVGIETPLGRKLSQVKRYEAPIKEHPHTTFVLGHAGALQVDQGIRLARRYPNVYLELSSQGLPALRRILREAPRDRILFGSDWPFYHQAVPLAKVLIATEGDPALRKAVLHDNAARLLGLP